jgi:hypothetical protein
VKDKVDVWICDLRRIADEILTEGKNSEEGECFVLSDAALCIAMGINALDELEGEI